MENLIIVAIIAVIIGLVVLYIYKAKKRGAACIGCPCSKQCADKNGGCSCHTKR